MPEKSGSHRLRWKGFKGKVSASINPAPLLNMLGEDPLNQISKKPDADFIKAKHDKGSKVYRAFLDLGSGREEVFIKTFSQRQTWQVIMQRMREDPHHKKPHHYPVKLAKLLYQPALAKRCWRMSGICQKAGIPVAEPLLYLARRKRGFREEVLAVKGVNPRSAPDARQHFQSFFSSPKDKITLQRKREALSILGRSVRAICQSFVMLPDLKLHNMVLKETPGESPCLVLVDLSEAYVKKGTFPEITLLERFSIHVFRLPCFTGTDQVRLVKAYLEAGNDNRQWAEICRRIYDRAGKQGRLKERAPGFPS